MFDSCTEHRVAWCKVNSSLDLPTSHHPGPCDYVPLHALASSPILDCPPPTCMHIASIFQIKQPTSHPPVAAGSAWSPSHTHQRCVELPAPRPQVPVQKPIHTRGNEEQGPQGPAGSQVGHVQPHTTVRHGGRRRLPASHPVAGESRGKEAHNPHKVFIGGNDSIIQWRGSAHWGLWANNRVSPDRDQDRGETGDGLGMELWTFLD